MRKLPLQCGEESYGRIHTFRKHVPRRIVDLRANIDLDYGVLDMRDSGHTTHTLYLLQLLSRRMPWR